MALEMAEDLDPKIQLVLQKLSSLESRVEGVLQKFNVLEPSVKTIEGEIATLCAKTSSFPRMSEAYFRYKRHFFSSHGLFLFYILWTFV